MTEGGRVVDAGKVDRPEGGGREAGIGHTHRNPGATGRFLKDTRWGSALHLGKTSFREHSPRDSLHVSIGPENRISVHIDAVSPLAGATQTGSAHYAVVRVVLHSLSMAAERLVCVARGKVCRPSCELECERVSGESPPGQPSIDGASSVPEELSGPFAYLDLAVRGAAEPDEKDMSLLEMGFGFR